MNSPDRLHRLLTGFLCATFAFAVPETRAQALPELTIEGVPGEERVKLSWPDTGDTLKLDYSGDTGTRAAWAPVPDEPLLNAGTFSLQFDVGDKGGFWRLRRPDLVPPVFPPPTGSTSVLLGNVTRLRLAATDLGGPVTYTVQPSPLPEGAHLDEDGVLTFRPVEGMSGDYTLTFTATDIWGNSTTRTVTLTVNLPPAGTPTSFTGLVIDLDATAGGGFVPIVNARVALLGMAHAAFTDATGRFTMSGIPGGLQVLDITTANAEPGPGGAKYAFFRENYRLIPNVANVDDRPFYLPRLDESSMTPVVPGLPTGVVNPTLNIAMTVGANTAVTDDGSGFTGELSITRVPEELAPAKLPDELGQTSLVTIQPVGVTFTTPAPITFPNTDNLPPGAGTDLWSLDPKSGSWVIVGTGRVTPDGQWIETVSGGIRAAEWHATMPPQPCPENGGDDPEHHDPNGNCNGASGSEVSVHTGGLRTAVKLPAWYSGGTGQQMRFIYNSRFAYPYIIVPYNAVNSIRAAVPNSISQEITLGGSRLGFTYVAAAPAARAAGYAVSSRFFYDTSRLSESRDEFVRMAFGFDASNMETGYYPYRALVTSNYSFSSIGASFNRRCTVINESRSPFGAGWTLEGVQRLHPVPGDDRRYLVTSGDGGHSLFSKGVTDRPFVVGGFSAARSGTQSFPEGSSFAGARAAILAAYPQATFQGLDTISAGGLAAVDLLVLSPITGPTTATELTAAEQSALFAWVRTGGCALICVDHDLGRAAFNAADESLISPFGITSENSSGDIVFVSPENSPITSGVHGDVPRYTRAFGGRKVISPGNWGRSIAIDPQGGIGLVEVPENRIAAGSGQVLVVTDAQLFLDGGAGIGNTDHRALLLNTIDSFLTTQEPPGADLVFRGPKGDFSRLLLKADGTFARRYVDGREVRFNAAGQHTLTMDPAGNAWMFTYDGQGRVVSILDPGGKTTALNYNGAMLANVVAPGGRTTSFQHDARGDLTGVSLPGNGTYAFAYDDRHLMVRETTPGGFQVDREYDACGRLVRTRWPDGTVREVAAVMSAAAPNPNGSYGTEENPAPVVRRDEVEGTFKSPAGTTVAKTNNFGQETDVTFPDGQRLTVERDANGLPTRTSLPTGEVFTRVFNRSGMEVDRTDVLFGGRQQRGRDSQFQQVVSYTDSFNQTWTSQLDGAGHRTGFTAPSGLTVSAAYNMRGALSSLTLPALPAGVTFTRDNSCSVLSMVTGTGPEARTTAFQYDASGRPVQKTDPMNGVTTFTWHPGGEMASLTTPGGRIIQFGVNGANQPVAVTPPGRPQHQLIRDIMGRVVEYRPPAGGTSVFYAHQPAGPVRISAGGIAVNLERDAFGNILRAVFPRGAATFTYNGGLLASAQSADGVMQTFQRRGPLMTRVAFSGPVTGEVNDTYDAGRRFQSTKLNDRAAVSYGYNADSMLVSAGALQYSRSATTGRVVTATIGGVSESVSNNDFAEESERTVRHGATVLAAWTRTFDKLSRIVSEQEDTGGGAVTYAYNYDADGRLITVTRNGSPWYAAAWDENNNRTSVTGPGGTRAATFDNLDRITGDGASTFTWDAAGHLAGRTGPGAFTCTHDGIGHLTGVTRGDGTVISYLLDGDGRRTVKLVNGVRTRAFLWSAFLRLRGELDAAGQPVSEFVYGLRPHLPEYMIRGGETYRLVTDLRGSVRLVVNTATGDIAQKLDYSPWGEVLTDSNPGFQPFGFAGGLYDPDTSLVTFGMRTYDPATGRWLSRDPIGFYGGDGNLYAYCGGDPVNKFDPMGLAPPRRGGSLYVGPTFSLGGGGGFTFTFGIVLDTTGNVGLAGSYGIGPVAGAGGSLTATGQVTGGDIYTLRGSGVNAGASGGEIIVGGLDVVSSGEGLNAEPIGGAVNIGLGVGTPVEGHAFSTQTGVVGFNIPNALSTAWNFYFGP